jgi:hypothetical protein
MHSGGCEWSHGDIIVSSLERLPLESIGMLKAAANGHLEIMQSLHLNGCPWDANACSGAAENGKLEIWQYIHLNGYPWDARPVRWRLESVT